ncbi:MAG: tRNA (adenosine(37)-N6)-threonylcarbamoyltransferase complex transferase subunit TsaD [Patescibacteria group bacterium]
MKILSIETSCDETAISIVDCSGELKSPQFKLIASSLISQINLHKEYGGVFPTLAKREHATNLPIILKKVMQDSSQYNEGDQNFFAGNKSQIELVLSKEIGLFNNLEKQFSTITRPDVDHIAVTVGPGLAPALWVGISFARALSLIWNIPLVPVNHMEGHITSVLMNRDSKNNIVFPALAVLISGGHTEIVSIPNWGTYNVIGATLDDAVGEAFDKSARMMGLPYPGGPEISRLATYANTHNIPKKATLPRPMLHSKDLNFSFSGLKTAVLYYIRDHFNADNSSMTELDKADLAREIEASIIDVLIYKTKKALEETMSQTLIVAGGVIASTTIRSAFMALKKDYEYLDIRVPSTELSTDNSTMIACAGYITILTKGKDFDYNSFTAEGNLKLK